MATPTIHELLRAMVERGASDLHLTAGSAPILRVDGKLVSLGENHLSDADTKQLCYSFLTDAQKFKFEEEFEIDLSFGIKGLSRFRANVYMQQGTVAAALRTIPFRIMSFEELGLPQILAELSKKPKGLLLVTGPTGCGKSTTISAMLDKINNERNAHIVTIEDPIEFVHSHRRCLVNQREVGKDSRSFHAALRVILRQDPDIILIGEMRDLETVESALSISETGHLTFATLHTNSCVQTINRIIDVFPTNQQPQARVVLSFVLEGIICQTLIPKIGGGRVLATEIMIPNPAIRNLIRENKIEQIYSTMQSGQTKSEMKTMNQSLYELYKKGTISYEQALNNSISPKELEELLKKGAVIRKQKRYGLQRTVA